MPIQRGVRTANNFNRIRPPNALVVQYIVNFAYVLSKSAQFIGVKLTPNVLVLGMFLQLSVFEGLSRFFMKCRHFPVEEKFSEVTAAESHTGENRLAVCKRARCGMGSVSIGSGGGG